jgi:cell division protein FtsL
MRRRLGISDFGFRIGGKRSSGFRVRSSESRIRREETLKATEKIILLFFTLILLSALTIPSWGFAAEKWPGVDEAVVKKIAKEQGREAREPLIPTDQGDLLLFVFLLAGAVGGFIAGYYWRVLLVEKRTSKKDEPQGEIS